MEKVLEIKGLNKYFKNHHVLKDINLTIYEKEIIGFIGPNGAGKSYNDALYKQPYFSFF